MEWSVAPIAIKARVFGAQLASVGYILGRVNIAQSTLPSPNFALIGLKRVLKSVSRVMLVHKPAIRKIVYRMSLMMTMCSQLPWWQ